MVKGFFGLGGESGACEWFRLLQDLELCALSVNICCVLGLVICCIATAWFVKWLRYTHLPKGTNIDEGPGS